MMSNVSMLLCDSIVRTIMFKKYLTITVLLLCVGLFLVVYGMTSSSIVKVCQMVSPPSPPSRRRFISNSMAHHQNKSQKEFCIEQGLFSISFSMPEGSLSIATSLDRGDIIVRTVAGLLLMGCVGSVVVALILIHSACSIDSGCSNTIFVTTRRNGIGTVILFMNAVLTLSALSVYSKYKLKTVGNSQQFLAQASHALTGWELLFSSEQKNTMPRFRGIKGPPPFMNRYPPRFVMGQSDGMEFDRQSLALANRFPPSSIPGPHYSKNRTNSLLSYLIGIPNSRAGEIEKQEGDLSGESGSGGEDNLEQSLKAFNKNSVTSLQQSPESRRKRNILPGRGRRLPDVNTIAVSRISKLKNSNPRIGHSFYLLWAGFTFYVLAFLSGIRTWITALKAKKIEKNNQISLKN